MSVCKSEQADTVGLYRLDGCRVLVTGASSGIGRACAVMASGLGATVVLTGRRSEALSETRRLMCATDSHVVVAGDLTDETFCTELVECAGRLDGFVHAAGVSLIKPLGMTRVKDVDEVFRINYVAFMRMMAFFAKSKYRNPGFSAVAVSSVSAAAGWPGGSVYCGSKGALSASVRALALELASSQARVNAVSPSNIRTPLFEKWTVPNPDEASQKALLACQPFGLGAPEQVASVVCFLLSQAASFITGVDLPVDGGYLAK